MPDFSKGKIYIIRSYKTDDVYIGSTTQTLPQRMAVHRCKLDTSSKKLLAHGDAYIELIEIYPCANRRELCIREGFHIQGSGKCVNKLIAGRTQKASQAAYRAANADKRKAYNAAYYLKNKLPTEPME